MLPIVLKETGLTSEASLNATIGNKTDFVINLKSEVINSPEHYVLLWRDGFQAQMSGSSGGAFHAFFDMVKKSPALKVYLDTFLRRSYLNHYDELYKTRPRTEEAEVWIGQNNADYGLLVSPRFANDDWENDESEIRHFQPRYWTIGHVLATGLVIPGNQASLRLSQC